MTLADYLKDRERSGTEVRIWNGELWLDVYYAIPPTILPIFREVWTAQYYQGQLNEGMLAERGRILQFKIAILQKKRLKLEEEIINAARRWVNGALDK